MSTDPLTGGKVLNAQGGIKPAAEATPSGPDGHSAERWYVRLVASAAIRTPRKDRPLRPLPPAVLKAARKTIRKYGVRRTSMGDIADAAGIPRPTLYEYVSGREQLIDLVLIERIGEIAAALGSVAAAAQSFSEAVVETSVEAVMMTRSDQEITNIFTTAPNRQVHQVLEGPNPEVARIVGEFLEPILQKGVDSGDLRADVSHELIVDWVRAVYSAFILRETVDRDAVRTMMRAFLLSSLTNPSPAP
jgi:AcrR family transcriptional regulator